MNNVQLINTLRQENKDLSQEICMLKMRLQERQQHTKKDHRRTGFLQESAPSHDQGTNTPYSKMAAV